MSDAAPLVSAIVPVYNTGAYLRECLDSLLSQTLRELEVVCVDDGSTDDSAKILEEYRAKDARVVVVTQANAGVSAARNNGVAHAGGKYVCFVDSDDRVSREFCAKTSEVAEKYGADVTRFYSRRELRKTCKRFAAAKRLVGESLKPFYDSPTLDERRLFVYLSGFHACWSCLYRREFWLEHQLQFPIGIRLSEDTYVNYAAFSKAKRVAFFEDSLYYWRKREGSASHPAANAKLGSYADTFKTYRMAREMFTRDQTTAELRRPLDEIFAYMQRNIQVPLSKQERALWRENVESSLDAELIATATASGSLPTSVRQFWLGLYGKTLVARLVGRAISGVFVGMRRAEAFFKRRFVAPLRSR